MLKGLEYLTQVKQGKRGNYKKESTEDYEQYYFYQTPVFKIDYSKQEITITSGGWGTQSTTRVINDLIRHYLPFIGNYKVIDEEGYCDNIIKAIKKSK